MESLTQEERFRYLDRQAHMHVRVDPREVGGLFSEQSMSRTGKSGVQVAIQTCHPSFGQFYG